jgi:iron-sulfur cluster assembly accessory protein
MHTDTPNTARTEPSILSATPEAVEKIKSLIAEKELTGYGLRVFVTGGGCSGLQYGMAFENNPREEDRIVEVGDGVRLIVDPMSLLYIQGASIDFVDNLMGGGFRIENPNAVTTCGCGSSFQTKEGGAGPYSGGGCACG